MRPYLVGGTSVLYPTHDNAGRLKVLAFAYACEPNKGSEPGVGWNLARNIAKYHDVWVLTRSNNRTAIEQELAKAPVEGLSFIYHDLPAWASWWKRGPKGVQLYSYLWHLSASRVGRKWHERIGFDAAHHLTFVKYWAPSGAAFVGVPYLWGPVGGGDGIPPGFWQGLTPRARFSEAMRLLAQRIGEADPLTRRTARGAALALGATAHTCDRLRALGAPLVSQKQVVALSEDEIGDVPARTVGAPGEGVRFVSVGRLEGWKGFHLAITAFARARIPGARYVIVGDGPERERLRGLAHELGVSEWTSFTGPLARSEVLRQLAWSDVLVQPSLHDSGGTVTLEAMAYGLPVIALRLGGPAYQVTEDTGLLVGASSEQQVVSDMAAAMRRLAADPDLRRRLGEAGKERRTRHFSWESVARELASALSEIATRAPRSSLVSSEGRRS